MMGCVRAADLLKLLVASRSPKTVGPNHEPFLRKLALAKLLHALCRDPGQPISRSHGKSHQIR